MIADPTSILVFGPAYLDRVIRVDRPLLDPALGFPPLDRSVTGHWTDRGGDSIRLVDPSGSEINVNPPIGWPGGLGTIALERPFVDGATPGLPPRRVRGVAWADDLGGMGAGFAASLGGTLISALGASDDPTTRAVEALLDRALIPHEPARIDHPADWTLLISSGPHGDKLPIGFRGCHAAWSDLGRWVDRPARVRVVAGLPNRLAWQALGEPTPGTIRAFFPAARNMLDRRDPPAGLADRVDLLSCNRGEWLDLGDQAAAFAAVPILAITDGPRGATIRYRTPTGTPAHHHVPPFPLPSPITDTNRAGEAFASTLLQTLLTATWTPGPTSPTLIHHAAHRAAIAAALTLRRPTFGFPTPAEIDAVDCREIGSEPNPDSSIPAVQPD